MDGVFDSDVEKVGASSDFNGGILFKILDVLACRGEVEILEGLFEGFGAENLLSR